MRDIFVEEAGEGHPIILLHGFGGSSRYWRFCLPVLSKAGYRAIALDLPGFGRSSLPDKPMAIANYVDVVVSLAKELQLSQVSLVGYSMGGLVASQIAATNPGLVKRLVLVSPMDTPYPAYLRFPGVRTLTRMATATRLGRTLAYPALYATFALARRADNEVFAIMRDSAREMKGFFRRRLLWNGPANPEAGLRSISSPTLIIWGSRDRIARRRAADFFRENISDNMFLVYDDVGHVPMFEAQDRFHLDILSFLSSQEEGGGRHI